MWHHTGGQLSAQTCASTVLLHLGVCCVFIQTLYLNFTFDRAENKQSDLFFLVPLYSFSLQSPGFFSLLTLSFKTVVLISNPLLFKCFLCCFQYFLQHLSNPYPPFRPVSFHIPPFSIYFLSFSLLLSFKETTFAVDNLKMT